MSVARDGRDGGAQALATTAGATVAVLREVPALGPVTVALPDGAVRSARLLATVERGALAVGCEVLVLPLADGGAVVLGALEPAPLDALLAGQGPAGVVGEVSAEPGRDPRTLTVRGKTVRIEGDDEVELRCGEASIVLRADGSVECRGVNVLTHADELQRIRGAVVKIN